MKERLAYELDGPETDEWREIMGVFLEDRESTRPVIQWKRHASAPGCSEGGMYVREADIKRMCECWDACAGMEDPVAEVARLRKKESI